MFTARYGMIPYIKQIKFFDMLLTVHLNIFILMLTNLVH